MQILTTDQQVLSLTIVYFQTLKPKELSPLKLTNSQVFLEQSVDRLYKGSRPTTQSVDMQNTPLFQLAEVVCEKS